MKLKKKDTEKEIIIDRIKSLIKEKDTKPAIVSHKIGAHKSFLYDLYNDRKATMTVHMIKKLAKELDCDVGYLIGETSKPLTRGFNKVILEGTIEADVWMPPQRDQYLLEEIECPVNPRIPFENLKFYRLFLSQLGFGDVTSVACVVQGNPIAGDIVAVQRLDGELIERSLRKTHPANEGFLLKPVDVESKATDILLPLSYKPPKGVVILGVVQDIHNKLNSSASSRKRKS